jgi:hypothetical protein
MKKSLLILCLLMCGCSFKSPECKPRYSIEKINIDNNYDFYAVEYINSSCYSNVISKPMYLQEAEKLADKLNNDLDSSLRW